MKVVFCGPISLDLLRDCLFDAEALPKGYECPLMAYLVRALVAEGIQVYVVTSCCEVTSVTEWKGINLHVFATPRRRHNAFFLDAYRKEVGFMSRVIREIQPDIVHANWTYEFADAAMRSGLPYLVTAHDSPWSVVFAIRNVYTFYRTIYSSLHVLPRIKHLSFVSPHIQKECCKYQRLTQSQYIVPNGISADLVSETHKKKVCNRAAPNYICVSGGGRGKNVQLLLQAFRLVKARIPQARLVVIGLRKFDDFGKDIESCGKLSHQEVMEQLSRADIFVNTALEESFCMTVLEAMASGLPCIGGKDSGGVPWLLDDGGAGLVVDVTSAEAVAEAMVRLVDEPDLYAETAKKGHERAKQSFTIESVARQYIAVYEEILEGDCDDREFRAKLQSCNMGESL